MTSIVIMFILDLVFKAGSGNDPQVGPVIKPSMGGSLRPQKDWYI
jgi:hypothetical protein